MKISIVVNKNLNSGQKANVSAIIAGQFGRDIPNLFTKPIVDNSGTEHAGISVNVVILNGNGNQLLTLLKQARENNIKYIVFSTIGQSLNNDYDKYVQKILSSDTESTQIIGVGIYGDEETVKMLTRKFSLAK